MPQPTSGDVHVNQPLTSISIAYQQKATNFIASRVFPSLNVQKKSDRYYVYDRGSFNRDEMEIRAPATESPGSGYSVDNTPTYNCDVWALHKDVDDQIRANSDSVLSPDRDATVFLTNKALIRREKLFVARFFTNGVWSFGRAGVAAAPSLATQFLQWNDAASTPIEDIRLAKRVILESTGFEPNKLTLGRPVYDVLADHPDILDRLKYGQTGPNPAQVTREKLAALFEVDEVLVMNAIENTAKEGQAAVHSFIGGKHAMLSYAPSEPGLLTPSAGYTFNWSGFMGSQGSGFRIKSFRMEHLESDRVEIQMATDLRRIGADLGYFYQNAVA